MKFTDNIQHLLNEKNISAKQMLEDLKLAKNAMSEWKSERIKPSIDTLQKISEYFNVSTDYLLTGKDPIKKPTKGVWIPVMGEIAAGIPLEAITNIIDYEEITKKPSDKSEYFGLKVKGDSMFPYYLTGDVVIVKKQPDVETGQVAIVLVDGENATVKKINKTDKGIMLIPLNTNYEAVFYSNEEIISLPITIIGVVVELRRKI
jgi:repressor LexA